MSSNGQHPATSTQPLRKKIENYSYSSQDRLGSGYSSEVFRGRDDRTGSAVAVKVVSLGKVRQKGLEDMLNQEIRLLKELKHPNVIKCFDVLMTTNNCYIVTEYCPQGDLASLLAKKGSNFLDSGRLPAEEVLRLISGICNGLAYLHGQGVMHRDIKPQNILLQGHSTKIADFGFACRSQLSLKEKYTIGSPLYMSPQALIRREYSAKNDIWALGMTIYEILEGRPPWYANNEKQLREYIKGEINFKAIKSSQLQNIVRGCLRYQASIRLTSIEVLSQVETAIGVRSNISWEDREDKENKERGNGQPVDDQEIKKAMCSNYIFLKWLINYSRFSAKLLPSLQNHLQCDAQIKQPLVELTARVLHLTISKLSKVQEVHQQLGLSHFPQFKRTSRFAKIQAVTAEYHQRHLLLLTRLPYKYHHPPTLAIDLPTSFIDSLCKLPITPECSQQHLLAADFLITLTHFAKESKNIPPHAMIHLADFERLVETPPVYYCANKVEELQHKRAKLAQTSKKM